MATDQLSGVIPHLRRAAALQEVGGLTDGQLLERFRTVRDGDAFEALVRRHGPMVLGVCRRVLRHHQDAEDAFQATFLVLAKKAASLTQRELVGNWLYGAAYRAALTAKAVRRRSRERQVSIMPEPEVIDEAVVWRDLGPLLEQELSRLPDKYRVAVVLCDLEGRTRREVAQQLGVPEGTLSGRLTTARRMLAERLARRGLTLSGGTLAAVLSQAASACLPASLVAATVHSAALFTAAKAGAVAVIPAQVAALAQRVLRGMALTRLEIAVAALLVGGLMSLGVGLLAHTAPAPADKPDGPTKWRERATLAGPAWSSAYSVAFSPDGDLLAVGCGAAPNDGMVKVWETATGKERRTYQVMLDLGTRVKPMSIVQSAAFSSDGKTLAAASASNRQEVVLWDVASGQELAVLEGLHGASAVAFSPNGKLLASAGYGTAVRVWDLAAKQELFSLKQADTASRIAFSPDGRRLASVAAGRVAHVKLWDLATGREIADLVGHAGWISGLAISPDGKVLATCAYDHTVKLWDLTARKEQATLLGHTDFVSAVAFSPDGRTLASAGKDRTVRLWDVGARQESASLEGHGDWVLSVAFSPRGKALASGSEDGTVKLWDLQTGARAR